LKATGAALRGGTYTSSGTSALGVQNGIVEYTLDQVGLELGYYYNICVDQDGAYLNLGFVDVD
jgi:hypothetical protein